MKAEQWLRWILYLLATIVLLGLLDLVFQQAFSNRMGPPAMGLANSLFLGFINFFFYGLIIILVLVIIIAVFVFSVQLVTRLFTNK
ncbi:hypothetical protein [Tuberibacillus sp. Marseille-P3662]|uniref:hypothetical protein n=1 Tax=Tuberibacillus sp. Marseille-P3662 TaxID=1965358 RepID=UPI000A1CA18D|nr:hypothetical protein [Tuberibacillus sp. Marseille-P3662]